MANVKKLLDLTSTPRIIALVSAFANLKTLSRWTFASERSLPTHPGILPLITSPNEFRTPTLAQLIANALAGTADNHALAAYLSSRAALAYQDPAVSEARISDEGGRNFASFEKWNISAFGYTHERHAFIAFRGTRIDDPRDWLVDFAFIPWSWPPRHFGFHCAWHLVRRRIVNWIEKLPADSRNLVLTGHSLGGALAVMAAFHLARFFPVRFVFTFGQPRVGLPIFSEYYGSQSCDPGSAEKLGAVTRRYMHETDLIPRLPPPVLYTHVGSRWLLDSSGNCSQGRPKGPIRRFEEAYYDLEFQSTLSSDEKTAAPQHKDWHEALQSRTGQSPPSPPTPAKVDPARQILNAQSQGPRFILLAETWKRLFSNLHWLIAVPAPVIRAIIGVIMFWSYKRDIAAHLSQKYVAAFHNKYPLLFRIGDVDPRMRGR